MTIMKCESNYDDVINKAQVVNKDYYLSRGLKKWNALRKMLKSHVNPGPRRVWK